MFKDADGAVALTNVGSHLAGLVRFTCDVSARYLAEENTGRQWNVLAI